MRRLLPRVTVLSATSFDPTDADEPELKGFAIIFSWLGLVAEVSLGRHV